jgi:flavin reductase (DIM6/NTAB) family NADH-FMN oxidoreductase RutF
MKAGRPKRAPAKPIPGEAGFSTDGEDRMSDEVVYRSNVRIERVEGPLRRAYLPAEAAPVLFGVHSEIAQHYGVDATVHAPHAATLDYVVAAAAGWLTGTFGGTLEARGISAGDGRLISEATGEVETEGRVLVIKRIRVRYRLRLERASFAHISATKEFVLNIPPVSLVRAVDFCGMVSGRDVDKFEATGLTMEPSIKVRPPLIAECPINLECVVRQSLELGSHVLFLAEVVALHADNTVVEDGTVIVGRVAPLAYDPFGGDYWKLKEVIAHQGFSEGAMPPGSAKRNP